MDRSTRRRKAASTASALRELNCSVNLIAFELSAKYGYGRSDAERIARESFRQSERTPAASGAVE
jgi:hypothetical protein